ncbi:phage tail tube protein [Schlesneria sp.]|uniref:phage tail tube protein n=1 Tax=Schlesneria sp. TaxID=2762018 RepID=UPI002EDEC8B8
MTEQMAYASRMTIAGHPMEFKTHSIKQVIELSEDDGLRGSRSRVLERVAQGLIHVSGQVELEPTPAEVAILLPLIVSYSTTETVLTDALADVTIVIDNGTKTDTFVGRFTKGTFSGSSGQKIQLTVDFVGKTRATSAGGSLSGVPDITARPYMFYDMGSGITIGEATYSIDKFELTIDNHIEPTFMQGQVATDLEPTDRTVSLGVQTKYTATEDPLLVLATGGPDAEAPLAASITFTNGDHSMSFSFGAIVAKSESVVNNGKRTKLRLPLNYHCYKVGTTLETVPVLV